jgi:hypothetical protein
MKMTFDKDGNPSLIRDDNVTIDLLAHINEKQAMLKESMDRHNQECTDPKCPSVYIYNLVTNLSEAAILVLHSKKKGNVETAALLNSIGDSLLKRPGETVALLHIILQK